MTSCDTFCVWICGCFNQLNDRVRNKTYADQNRVIGGIIWFTSHYSTTIRTRLISQTVTEIFTPTNTHSTAAVFPEHFWTGSSVMVSEGEIMASLEGDGRTAGSSLSVVDSLSTQDEFSEKLVVQTAKYLWDGFRLCSALPTAPKLCLVANILHRSKYMLL